MSAASGGSTARPPDGEGKRLGLSRRARIDPFVAMDVLREANERQTRGENIIHMEIGQPATPAPPQVREAALRAIHTNRLGYTEAKGIPELRERIAAHYASAYGASVAPDRVIVTTGSSAGFVLAFLALFDEGARVGLPAPGYPCYRQIVRALGLTPVLIDAREETRWMPSAQALEAAGRGTAPLDGLIVASPANPTGTMLAPAELRNLAQHCQEQGIRLISDEIYHGLTYAVPPETALNHNGDALVINSFSKYYSMTGWRIGWMVVPEYLIRPIEQLQQNLYIAAPTLSQLAAITAFDAHAELEEIKARYERNRAYLLQALPAAGLSRLAPADGAFYVYADVSRFTDDSRTFAARMLAETGIAVTPGVDFDPHMGTRYIRFCYAGAYEEMVEAMDRLAAWLK